MESLRSNTGFEEGVRGGDVKTGVFTLTSGKL